MLQLLTSLDSVEFLPRLEYLEFSADTPFGLTVSVDSSPVFQARLTPSGGRVRLTGIASLVRSYLTARLEPFNYFDVELAATPGGRLAYLKCVPSMVLPDLSAADWLRTRWLTFGPEHTLTWAGASEPLAAYTSTADEGSAASVTACLWDDGRNALRHVTVPLPPTFYDEETVCYLDCSPAAIRRLTAATEAERLLRYDVTCGARHRRYTLLPSESLVSPVTTLRFYNAFGVPDVLHCYGGQTAEQKPKFDRARFGTMLRNYRTDSPVTRKLSAGPLLPDSAPLLTDLMNSPWVETGPRCPVVLTDGQCTFPDRPDQSPSLTVSLQDAGLFPVLSVRRPRIFDRTFDRTFE